MRDRICIVFNERRVAKNALRRFCLVDVSSIDFRLDEDVPHKPTIMRKVRIGIKRALLRCLVLELKVAA